MAPRTTTHQSLHRAIDVLRTFSEQEPNLTVGEVAQRTGIHKSTCSRILAALLTEGLVWQDEASGRYSLGLGLVELAGVALGQIDVRRASITHIERLARELDETVSVAVLRGDEAVTVAWASGSHSIRHVVWIGRRVPLATTASGRIFLAARRRANDEWRALDPNVEPGATADGTPEELAGAVDAAATQGVAIEIDDFEVGTTSVAVPIHDGTGTVVAALSVGAPTDRFDGPAIDVAIRRLQDTAELIASELGLRPVVAS